MEEPKKQRPEEKHETLVRILGYDIDGGRPLYSGLTRIKGVSWSVSNAVCKKLGLNPATRVHTLDKKTIAAIEAKLRNLDVFEYMKNRRHDFDTGNSMHIIGTDLDVRKEFDIKRLKQIKSYRGIRHMLKQPVRGQRTRSHFRTTGLVVGVKKGGSK